MSALLQNAIDSAFESLDRVRADLRLADVHAVSSARSDLVEKSAIVKAWSYVWMAAVLEQYVKEVLNAVLSEINARGVSQANLRRSLFSLVFYSDFDALKSASKIKAWNKRSTIFRSIDLAQTVEFSLNVHPLDGRTIKADHFECIWNVFGFVPPHLPHPKHGFALNDLADGRNRVAHGEIDPVRFGRSKTCGDVVRILDLTEEAMLHLWETANGYLKNNGYLA